VAEWASKRVADERSAAGTTGQTIAFEDQALIDRCRQGEIQAFGLLVAKYQDRVFNLVRRMCSRQADAEELAQEVFLRALERLDQFRGHSQFYTWLFRIAANMVLSHRRKNRRMQILPLGDREDCEPGGDAALRSAAGRQNAGPEAAAISAETTQRVAEALERLDEEHRVIVILRDMEDMDYAAIAAVLDVPIGTVKSRLHRARSLLREKLAGLV
jgi:RNA polymerase sigma-70 factor (ECF subfamily)